jgi:hypothetical protein
VKRLLWAVLAGGVLLGWTADAAAQNDRYGIHTYYLSPYLAAKSRDLGAGYVRIQIDWDTVQPDGPGDWDDAPFLSWLNNARLNHLKLYATLMNTPAWAGPCQHCMPDGNGPWQNFVYRVIAEARAYFPDVEIVFGIWNEPNLTGPRGFFNGTDSDYATLFQLADVARRSANPNARLAGPEMSVGGFDPAGYLNSVMAKLQPSMRPGDVITFHWYPGQGSLTDWASAFNAQSRGQEVWLTETGDNTCNDTEQRGWLDFIVNTFDYGNIAPHWTKVFIYYLWDAYTNCAANLVRIDGSNRPAYVDYHNRATGQSSPLVPVNLRTATGNYMSADLGGGGEVTASRTVAGAWETFDLLDMNGGSLRDGDPVALQTAHGLYLQADQGGNGPLAAVGFAPGAWETFTLGDVDRPGGIVQSGDRVTLRSSAGYYISAELGGGGVMNVNRTSAGAWETFRLQTRN